MSKIVRESLLAKEYSGSHFSVIVENPLENNQLGMKYLTTKIVSAYVTKNPVRIDDLPILISMVFASLTGMGASPLPLETLVPAVPIRKSITPDYLISLEDGKSYKSLKRHLANRGMTPEDYRIKWGLKSNYPMASPNYAKQRSERAREFGLGREFGISRPLSSQR